MSRKHYIKFAEAIREISNPEEKRRVAESIARVCKEDNSNFDYSRFYRACGVEG